MTRCFLYLSFGLFTGMCVAETRHTPKPYVMPLFFFPGDEEYIARTPRLSAEFRTDGVTLRFAGSTVGLTFAGSTGTARVEAADPLGAKANLLIGDEAEWRTAVPLYGRLVYRGLYRGIDLAYSGTDRRLKSEFHVRPGADPRRIAMQFSGAESVSIDLDGSLVVRTVNGEIRESAPVIFQEGINGRQYIAGSFRILSPGVVGFDVDPWDENTTLVIDPSITYSTFLGGSGLDQATAVAVDGAGNAYVAGYTDSPDFPVGGAYQPAKSGGVDGFVAKLSPAGNELIYATYIGGKYEDRITAIGLSPDGSVVVGGYTSSTQFPTASVNKRPYGGTRDGFVSKLNAAGTGLVFSTYLGGSANDAVNAIAVDAAGNVFVAGDTSSTNFPMMSAYQATYRGRQDAFFTKFNPAGALQFSSYFGGSGEDKATAVVTDAAGSIYMGGSTTSVNLPVSSAVQPANAGGMDGFAAKFAANGTTLVYSTYIGGRSGAIGSIEAVNGIAVDTAGNLHLVGTTSSNNFPSVSPVQTAYGGGTTDAFAAKLNAAGNALLFSTYFGGLGLESGAAIAVDSAGNVFITGSTTSRVFPTTFNAVQRDPGGGYDAFIAQFSTAGVLLFSSFYGGTGSDTATAIVVDASGSAWIAGFSSSTSLPGVNGYETVGSQDGNAFVTKLFIGGNRAPVTVSINPVSATAQRQVFTTVVSDPDGAADLGEVHLLVHTAAVPTASNVCHVLYRKNLNQLYLYSDTNALLGPLTPGAAGSQQNTQCILHSATSAVTSAGNDLSLVLDLERTNAYQGLKNVYAYATDSRAAASAWDQRATWRYNPPPVNIAVGSNSGTGMSNLFTFRASMIGGYQNIYKIEGIIGTTSSERNTCYIYSIERYYIFLRNDGATGWLGPLYTGLPGSVSNSQCTISNPVITGSGETLDLRVNVSFTPSYPGPKTVWQNSTSTALVRTNWDNVGSWNVAP